MTFFRFSAVIITLIAIGSQANPARATVVRKMDLESLVGQADKIIRGKVESQSSRWTTDRRYIVTDMVLRVSETLDGQADERVTVRRLGGVVDGIGMKVVGATVLEPGEDVVLFSQKRGRHRFIVGMRQGVYHLQRDANGKTVVGQRLQSLTLAERSSPKGPLELNHAEDNQVAAELLPDFLRRLRETIKRCAGQPKQCRN